LNSHPAQGAGRTEPRAEAEGRRPGSWEAALPRGLSGRLIVAALESQGIGLRPHPWAGISRPVGPDRTAIKLREKKDPGGAVPKGQPSPSRNARCVPKGQPPLSRNVRRAPAGWGGASAIVCRQSETSITCERKVPLIGGVLSHYELLDALDGEDAVWRARDTRNHRLVRLRLLARREGADLGAASVARGLVHPNLCALEEVGEAEGRLFLAWS